MAGGADVGHAALLLRFGERGSDLFEGGEMLIDVRFRMLNRDGPLLVPPIGLREYAAIHHAKPVVAPEIDVDFGPVAVVANFLRVEHEGAVDAGARNIRLQTGLLDDGAIALGKFLAEVADVRIGFAREDFAERSKAPSHGYAIRVVGTAVKNFVLRD